MTQTLTYEHPPPIRQNPFGKHQRTVAGLAWLFLYQIPFYLTFFIIAYAIISMDFNLIVILIVLTILQVKIKKYQPYINFVNKYINLLTYFKSFKRIYQQRIPQDKRKCLFSFHPHSVFGLGTIFINQGMMANMNYDNDPLSGMVGLCSRFILNTPFAGLVLRLWGLQAVNAQNLKRLMINNQNIGLIPGGFEQATLTTSKQFRVFIENRKGFIKYAMKYNYTIYPVIVLNQHQAYWTFDYGLKFRMLMNKIKLPGVLYFNKKSLIFFPSQIQFVTVVGKGLKGKQYKDNQQPSYQQIQQMHKQYIKEVKRLYDKYKHQNGNKPLVMF